MRTCGHFYTLGRGRGSDRFKAASVNEGLVDIPYSIFHGTARPFSMSLFRVMWGFGSPYDPEEMKAMMGQSPIYNIQHVKTPVLLEYGLSSWAPDQGRIFFQALQYFDVPSEFIVYPRTGQGINEPLLREDSMKRNLAWFDYWLRGKPYPDAAKQARYDRWKQNIAAMAKPRN